MHTSGPTRHRDAIDALPWTSRELRTLLGDLLGLRHGNSWELDVADSRLTIH